MNDADKQRITKNVEICRRREALSLAVGFLNGRETNAAGTKTSDVIDVAEVFRNYIENGVQQ
ncbi:hypothetical protein ACFV6Y_38455 [Streptomyces massasporeus]|uniref:hypothetical protein n=1 Tax=Streptomyces massasporeus TaxID=67324 RepID=UPI003658404E